ncbi:MAG: DUF1674 domain-containing protein [Lysobacteraceae bacterium]
MIGQVQPAPEPAEASCAVPQETLVNTSCEAPLPREVGGRPGLEPTRYGDWEKNGRCIDF